MQVVTHSLSIDYGAQSQVVTLAGAGVANKTPAIGTAPGVGMNTGPTGVGVLITPKVDCFVRQGPQATVTATNDGTDIALIANNTYRSYVAPGNGLSFNSTTGGAIYVTIGG